LHEKNFLQIFLLAALGGNYLSFLGGLLKEKDVIPEFCKHTPEQMIYAVLPLHFWLSAMFGVKSVVFSVAPTHAINCYTCSSVNGSDVNCMDPFNPAMSTYKEKCMVPKQGHIGVFPANFCIKIRGQNSK